MQHSRAARISISLAALYAITATILIVLVARTGTFSLFAILILLTALIAFLRGIAAATLAAALGVASSAGVAIHAGLNPFQTELAIVSVVWFTVALTIGRLSEQRRRIEASRREVAALLNEKTLLLDEVHHRVKNHMAIVRALIGMSLARGAQNCEEVLEKADQRIATMMRVYDTVYAPQYGDRVELRDLFATLIRGLEEIHEEISDLTIHAQIADTRVPRRHAVAVGVVVNELVSNAFKYSDGTSGDSIGIHADRTDDTRLTITIESPAPGFPDEVVRGERSGFGIEMARAYAREFSGDLIVENTENGRGRVALTLAELDSTEAR